jgi:hypothetical protein
MRFYVVSCLLFLSCCFSVEAQLTDVSAPTKLSTKISKVKMVGKNQDGYVVRFSGTEEVINVYNEELKLSTAKTLDLKGQSGELQHILLNKTGASLFYLHAEKKMTILLAQPVNSKFLETNKAITIDTFFDRHDLLESNLHFKGSFDQNYLLFYYPIFTNGMVEAIQLVCVDRSLSAVYKKRLPINRPERDMEYAKALVDNDGNGFFIFSAEKDGKDKTLGDEFNIVRFDKETGDVTNFKIASVKEIFSEPQFEIDNVNHTIVFCGFYDETGSATDPAASGFFYQQYDSKTGALNHFSYNNFSTAFMAELTGREGGNMNNKLFTFAVKKILLRIDGGALIIAESFIRDKREVLTMSASMMNPYNQYHTVQTFQYNDVIAFSVKPDASLDWSNVMRKKQVSEDDAGANSSFALLNQKDKIHLIYMDDIAPSAPVDEYILNSTGISNRTTLFGQEEKDVFVLPKLAKQVSPNEVIMPSVRAGAFRLVRITY